MSKTLYLIRHAHAEDGFGTIDKDRHLTAKGRAQAEKLGDNMVKHELTPDYALVSSSNRTVETFKNMNFDVNFDKLDSLYSGSPDDYLEALALVDDAYSEIMIIGHNPTCAMLAIQLSVEGAPSDLLALRGGFKKSQLAVIHFSVNKWVDVAPRSGFLSDIMIPDLES